MDLADQAIEDSDRQHIKLTTVFSSVARSRGLTFNFCGVSMAHAIGFTLSPPLAAENQKTCNFYLEFFEAACSQTKNVGALTTIHESF